MGRTFVRQTVAAWFQPPAVQGLNRVYTATPKNVSANSFFHGTIAGTPSGAIAFPHVEGQVERREVFVGPPPRPVVGKFVDYDVTLVVRFRSNQRASQDAVDDFDTTLDNIVARLRVDPNLGTANQTPSIFQAGEGNVVNGEDIRIMVDLPRTIGSQQQVETWAAVRFKVLEWV